MHGLRLRLGCHQRREICGGGFWTIRLVIVNSAKLDDCNTNDWNPGYLSYDLKQFSRGRKISMGFVGVVRSGSVA